MSSLVERFLLTFCGSIIPAGRSDVLVSGPAEKHERPCDERLRPASPTSAEARTDVDCQTSGVLSGLEETNVIPKRTDTDGINTDIDGKFDCLQSFPGQRLSADPADATDVPSEEKLRPLSPTAAGVPPDLNGQGPGQGRGQDLGQGPSQGPQVNGGIESAQAMAGCVEHQSSEVNIVAANQEDLLTLAFLDSGNDQAVLGNMPTLSEELSVPANAADLSGEQRLQPGHQVGGNSQEAVVRWVDDDSLASELRDELNIDLIGAAPLDLGTDGVPRSFSSNWSIDWGGTLRHRDSDLRISPTKGVRCGGHHYQLSPDDLVLEGEEGCLGRGACGAVSRGKLQTTGQEVAVKSIRASNSGLREQLLHEIQGLVKAEGCKFLVQWFAGLAAVDGSDMVHVVLEFMDLGSLADLSQRCSVVLPENLACITVQTVLGLNHLHSREVLHRDIKLQNILHNKVGEVKLTDFGISRSLGQSKGADEVMAATFVGTATYMSPERYLGDEYSYPSDIWSIGLVVHELAVGRHPFADFRSFTALWEVLCECQEPRLPQGEHPAVLCDFAAQCLCQTASERLDCQKLLSHPFISNLNRGEELAAAQEVFAAWLTAL